MTDLTCRQARRWLQVPEELALLDARHLDRHLVSCPDCLAYRRDQVKHDELIRQALAAQVAGISVREHVRARLEQHAPGDFSSGPAAPRFARLASVAAVATLVAAAILVALFLPQRGSRAGSVTPVGAAWHQPRPFIGFPVTIDRSRPKHLLAGAWGQVYDSWDGGATWRQLGALPSDLVVRDLAIDRARPGHYLVAVKHSILASDDAGRDWRTVASGLRGDQNMFLTQQPNRPSTFYVGPSVLWRSQNRGLTWTQAGSGAIFAPYGIQSLTIAANGDLYTGIWGGGVALSRDGGVTWRRLSAGLARNVMDVAISPSDGSNSAPTRLWAATDRGVYVTSDGGRRWRHSGPKHFFVTAVAATRRYVLAGGIGGIYRSSDGGAHWSLAVDGLPLAPYVYSLTIDPSRPSRVYASLNGDGIFRSDDGGMTWSAMNVGLPIARQDGTSNAVLFRRDGVLWITDAHGSDPGTLTVDQDVRAFAPAPDGGAVAYLAGNETRWSVDVVSPGAATRTLLTGTGPLPRRLLWSPDGLRLAVSRGVLLTVVALSGPSHEWSISSGQHLLAWTRDGRGLLFWSGRSGRVSIRSIDSGAVVSMLPGTLPAQPLLAPGGETVGLVARARLMLGSWLSVHPAGPLATGCRPTSWSDDGRRLLLACSGGVQERGADGQILARAPLPDNAIWVPGSSTDLLFFRGGGLWRWSPSQGAERIVADAQP